VFVGTLVLKFGIGDDLTARYSFFSFPPSLFTLKSQEGPRGHAQKGNMLEMKIQL